MIITFRDKLLLAIHHTDIFTPGVFIARPVLEKFVKQTSYVVHLHSRLSSLL